MCARAHEREWGDLERGAVLVCAGGCLSSVAPRRSLCQPYVEVFVNGDKVHTSVSKGNLKQIKQFTPADKWVEVALGVVVKGNVVVCVHHVRSLGVDGTVRRGRGRPLKEPTSFCYVVCGNVMCCLRCPCVQSMSGAKMFQIQFHSGFIEPGTAELVFGRYDHMH